MVMGLAKTCTFSLFFLETTNFDFILIFFLSSELFEAQNFTFFFNSFFGYFECFDQMCVYTFCWLTKLRWCLNAYFFQNNKCYFFSSKINVSITFYDFSIVLIERDYLSKVSVQLSKVHFVSVVLQAVSQKTWHWANYKKLVRHWK